MEQCRKDLRRLSWYWARDMLVVAVVIGLTMGLFVRRIVVGYAVVEAKRYEVWGRKIEQQIEKAPVKSREQFYRWMGGGP
jgi:hypothetical protein